MTELAHEHSPPQHGNGADASGPSLAVSQAVGALSSALSMAREVAESSADSRVKQPAADAVDLLKQALSTSTAQETPSTRLKVALVGRTKAGKTQLVKALSGDGDADGIGRGRHRTTRNVRTTELPGFDLLDLPGVAALDGEEDTALAVAAAAQADAVLWLYAESLHDTEAVELEDLLRRGKPTVVAYNAKWSVDAAGRRRVFAKHPELAFRDLNTHQERLAQIAERAGTQVLPLVAIHARAGWYGACEGDEALLRASRINDLVRACDTALTRRADVLRIRAQHDRPRRRLEELAAAARLVAETLGTDQEALGRSLRREADTLLRAVASVRGDAEVRLEAAVAEARRGVDRWVKRHRKAGSKELNSAWIDYVESSGIDKVLKRYTKDLRKEVARCQSTARVADIVDRQFRPATRHQAAPDRGWKGMLKTALRASRNALIAGVRRMGVDRGLAILLAKLGGRAAPGIGWWLVGIDVAQGLSSGLREEVAARRLRADEWQKERTRVCQDQLTWVRDRAASKLDEADNAIRADIAARLEETRTALDTIVGLRRVLGEAATDAEAAIPASDHALVVALLVHCGQTADIRAVCRVPNKETRVTLGGDSGNRDRALGVLRSALMPETVQEDPGVRSVIRRSKRRKKR